jgi:tetratricopeptide (TPR) repeat protein
MSAAVRVETRRYRMAELGGENRLPLVADPRDAPVRFDPSVPDAIVERASSGAPRCLHPYRSQDGYTRVRAERPTRAVVLENEHLTAVFLPELGGRLWELVDRRTGASLVHTPPAVQFANLALRNAWFAGGIEFNIGTRGHSPSTCAPLHTALVPGPDGTGVLRMWELERLRGVVFTIDAWLPPGSPSLFVRVVIRNPGEAVPMYWWTNAAVREDPAVRVLAPATSAFRTDYEGGVTRVDPRDDDGVDCTWPVRNPSARDFFFDVPAGRRPWVAAVGEDGGGLTMLSTAALPGRKLFTWGSGPGGRSWQRWLNPEGDESYFEIQSGLAPTQFEHVPLGAGAEVSWTEAYSSADVDARIAHGADWDAAVRHCEERFADRYAALDAAEAALRAVRDRAPGPAVVAGSGWGALEGRRRACSGEAPLEDGGAPFGPETLGEAQAPWLALLDGGPFGGADSFVSDPGWSDLLQRAAGEPDAQLHLGTIAHAEGRFDAAAAAYERVLAARADVLAHRGLALLSAARGNAEGAATAYEAACALDRSDEAVLIEAATALLALGLPDRALALLDEARVPAVEAGRTGYLLALASARTGEPARAGALLDAGLVVPDIREGEDSLAELWREVRPDRPVPADYRFDMRETAEGADS